MQKVEESKPQFKGHFLKDIKGTHPPLVLDEALLKAMKQI